MGSTLTDCAMQCFMSDTQDALRLFLDILDLRYTFPRIHQFAELGEMPELRLLCVETIHAIFLCQSLFGGEGVQCTVFLAIACISI